MWEHFHDDWGQIPDKRTNTIPAAELHIPAKSRYHRLQNSFACISATRVAAVRISFFIEREDSPSHAWRSLDTILGVCKFLVTLKTSIWNLLFWIQMQMNDDTKRMIKYTSYKWGWKKAQTSRRWVPCYFSYNALNVYLLQVLTKHILEM
jgi:hypothetical protein